VPSADTRDGPAEGLVNEIRDLPAPFPDGRAVGVEQGQQRVLGADHDAAVAQGVDAHDRQTVHIEAGARGEVAGRPAEQGRAAGARARRQHRRREPGKRP